MHLLQLSVFVNYQQIELIGSHVTPLRFTKTPLRFTNAVLTDKNQIWRYSQFAYITLVFLLIPLYDYISVYCPPLVEITSATLSLQFHKSLLTATAWRVSGKPW